VINNTQVAVEGQFQQSLVAEPLGPPIDDNKLTIQFDRAGEKRVVDSFVGRE
jgi:hypothetical protein